MVAFWVGIFITWFFMWRIKRYSDKRGWEPDNPRVILMFVILTIGMCISAFLIAPYLGYEKNY